MKNYYSSTLFVHVLLVVLIASGTFATLFGITSIINVTGLLAKNLSKASNYFFSYMVIQALAASAGNLLQVGSLLMWFIMPKLFGNTAREKSRLNSTLPHVSWVVFPTYTNFTRLALIYTTIAPLITIFAIFTLSVLWIANRYSMLRMLWNFA